MADDYVRRTAVTRLSVDDEQRDLLEETIAEWKRGCQIATDLAWRQCSSKADIQPLAYDEIREETTLGSQHAVLATHQAADAITSCLERESNGKQVSKPTFTAPTVAYDTRTMTLFEDETVSLSTVDSRVQCSLVLPDDDDGYQQQFLDSDTWSVTESTLTVREGAFYLHLGFRRRKTDAERETLPRTERSSEWTWASRTSLSPVPPVSLVDENSHTDSANSSTCGPDCSRPAREVHIVHSRVRVTASCGTSER